jgi:DNA repair exonuclease SbcCD ATPase subunit
MGLQLFRNLAPAQFQSRSPLHPEVEKPFETSPHECARYMVKWLKDRHVILRNAQNKVLEEAYKQLDSVAKKLPPPPQASEREEAIRQIMADQVERQLENERKINERRQQFEKQYRAEIVPLVRQKFAQVEQRVNRVAQRQLNQVTELNRDIRKEIKELRPAIEQIEREIAELKERETALEGLNNRVQEGIVVLRRTHQQLESETIQLEKRIKESEKAGLGVIGNALLKIGICAFGTLVIKCAMQAIGAASTGASGASVVLKPAAPNHIQVEATFKF